MSAETGLDELRDLFSWCDEDNHDARCATLERAQLTTVASTINAKLDTEVREELERQPDETYLAILGAPDMYFGALYGRPEDLGSSVARWIVAERAVLGAPAAFDGKLRAAGCDRHVAIAGGRVVAIDALPRIPDTAIAIDFTSELPSRMLTRFPDRILAPPTPEQCEAAAAKLAESMAVLDEVSPLAADFVRRMTDVICCRTVFGDGKFYTGSDETTLGVVHLLNLHLPRKTAPEVASELVHESIHQAVFRHELLEPLFDDPEVRIQRVHSPWTGAKLDLYTLVHACFVWYGVANLWRLSTTPALPAVSRQRKVAEAGFAKQPLSQVGDLATQLPAPLIAVIDEMTREICDDAA